MSSNYSNFYRRKLEAEIPLQEGCHEGGGTTCFEGGGP
jgi:hypothetical protein